MPADLQKARALFLHAVGKLPPEQWDVYVRQACAGNSELEQQVGRLLQVHREAGSFLDRPAIAHGVSGAFSLLPGEEPAAVPLPERPGTVIGPYKLLEQIGEGGFGLVFMAEQQQPVRRRVAVKILKPGMDTRQVIARFEAERQALALMDHPNIARVLDAGATACGRPHFVMELARGVPITDYCEQNELGTRERLQLFATVCDAVQHAHQKGIIHRDLKPSNVLVTLQDNVPAVKVIDFGIAKAIGQQLTDKTLHTGALQIIGTPLYMSPEQAELGGLDVDTRTDVYSLGVVLYELLTGTTPFDKERLRDAGYEEMRRIIREEDPPRPSTRLTTLSQKATVTTRRRSDPKQLSRLVRGELDWIVMKALEKDRARRYATASAFGADVQHFLHDEPVSACPPSAWYRFRKMAQRYKGTLVATALVSLALVAGTAVSLWQAVRATGALNDLADEQKATQRELGRAQQAEEKATRELFDALVAQARANRLSRRIGQRFRTLEIVRRATAMARQLNLPEDRFLELRNEAIAAMALPDLRVAYEWLTPGGFLAVFDSKLERYARTDRQGTVFVRRVGDGAEICRLTGYSRGELWYFFSPEGDYLAIADPSLWHLDVWQLTGSAPTRVLHKQTLGSWPQFSPNNREIAAQLLDGTICDFSLSTQDELWRLPAVPLGSYIAFRPDGAQLALTGAGGTQVHDVQSGKLIWQNDQAGEAPKWLPDGKTLAVYSDDAIFLWDADGGKPAGKMDGITGGGVTFAFNPTGTLLASRAWTETVRLVDPRNCRQILSVQTHGEFSQFSPDGRFLASTEAHNHLGIWEVAQGDEYRTLTANPQRGNRQYAGLSMTSDGRLLAAGSPWGNVCLWDLHSGRELAFLEEAPGYSVVAFEPRPLRANEAGTHEETLLTRGGKGLFRRSIHFTPLTGEFEIGPPMKLPVPGNFSGFATSRDGQVLAATQGKGAVVWHRDLPGPLEELGNHLDVRAVAVSPDGKWVLTGRYSHPGGIKVWSSQTGKCEFVRDLPCNHTWAVFSPDGKRLLTYGVSSHGMADARAIRRWEVGSWVESPFPENLVGRAPAFSPDGKFVVLETRLGIARLIDAETGREYARFEDPNQDRAADYAFTPDGTKLVCATVDAFSVHVWDLQMIRRQLAEMGLDWK
jgi:serine/threonine protein kinase/WD40 repeat protein